MNAHAGAPNNPGKGRLVTRPSDGVIEARDAEGRLLAHFNPRTNETRNHQGDLLAKGNRLAAVLREKDGPPARNRAGGK